MKAIIVEDSRLARQELIRLLRAYPHLTVLGEAADGAQALCLIAELNPDLIFLDIDLPGMNGFELLAELETIPLVIFTTAFDEYAIKAFEMNALDYLLKPINPNRLASAISRVEAALSEVDADPVDSEIDDSKEPLRLTQSRQIFIKEGESYHIVALKDIRLLESIGNNTRVYFGDKRPLVPKGLSQIEKRLVPNLFFRINRQQIVNLNCIIGIEVGFNGQLMLTLSDQQTLTVSRRHATRLKQLLSL